MAKIGSNWDRDGRVLSPMGCPVLTYRTVLSCSALPAPCPQIDKDGSGEIDKYEFVQFIDRIQAE
eukprot:777929-Rhodomonas_salina.1